MKEDDVQKELVRLKDKVRTLTEENEILTGKAEDIYLLGIISEKIGLESTEEKVLAIAVENIVNLKDISYCSFLLINNSSLEVFDDYGPNISESLMGNTYDPGKLLIKQLENGEHFREISLDELCPDFIPQFAGDHLANSYCLVPVIVRDKMYGILLTVNCFSTSDYLRGLVPLFVHVGDIVGARLAALSYMNEIKEWNKTLELKVDERASRLRESEEKYRSLVDGAGDGIITTESTGTITSWNRGARKIFGYEPEEIIGKHASLLAPEELLEEQKIKISEIIETGFMENFETERLRKSGKRVPVEMTASVMRNESGEIIGISTIIRDITERRKAEAEEKRLYENLKSLWGLAEQWESDIKTISDYVLKEIISRSSSKYGFYGFLNDDESIMQVQSWSKEVMKDCQVHGKPISYSIQKAGLWGNTVRERRVILVNDYKKDISGKLGIPEGHIPLTRVIAIPIFRKDKIVAVGAVANKETDYTEEDMKQLEGFLTSAQTIVDRKKAESDLLMFRNLMNRSNDAIFVIDPEEGKITDINSKACKNLGYSRKELLNMRVSDLDIRMQDKHAWSDHVQDVMAKGYVLIEGEHRRKDGEIFPVEINVNYFKWGEEAYMLAVSRDVSERKKLEDELQKSHKLESVGILAGGIAHDFNNLLSAIQTNVFLSKMHSGTDSKAYGRLEAAEKAIKRAAELTQQLMTFSRGGTPVKKTTSMGEIISESCAFTLRGSNVKCEYSDAGNLWPVDVDEGQMSQVIHNLILNADQSMPEGGEIVIEPENVTIHSDAGLPLEEGRYVKIAIKDRGTGIAEEHRQKIFDPYFTTKEMGRGLGLAITYSIIKKHGGLITVESKLGAGTAFILYIPASEKQVEHEDVKKETLSTGQGKILIMDDEEMVRNSLGEMLSYIGYDVEYAKDGSEAIEIYINCEKTSNPVDAVILDLTIPGGMGGAHTMKKLLEINPAVKAIVSSGYSNDPVMAKYREYGFCDVIVKPFKSPETLSLTLNRVINRST